MCIIDTESEDIKVFSKKGKLIQNLKSNEELNHNRSIKNLFIDEKNKRICCFM